MMNNMRKRDDGKKQALVVSKLSSAFQTKHVSMGGTRIRLKTPPFQVRSRTQLSSIDDDNSSNGDQETVSQHYNKRVRKIKNLLLPPQMLTLISKPMERQSIRRDHERSDQQIWRDYFAENCTYPPKYFRRRFRMRQELFLHILNDVKRYDKYFTTVNDSLKLFCNAIITLYEEQYLLSPNENDITRLLQEGKLLKSMMNNMRKRGDGKKQALVVSKLSSAFQTKHVSMGGTRIRLKRPPFQVRSRTQDTKKSTRGGKPATERPSSNLNLDRSGYSDRDPKHHQRLQDTLPLEAPPAPSSKVEIGAGSKAFGKQTNGQRDGTKNSSNPTQVPRSQSYFQFGHSFRYFIPCEHGEHLTDLLVIDKMHLHTATVGFTALCSHTYENFWIGCMCMSYSSTVSVVMPHKLVEPLVVDLLPRGWWKDSKDQHIERATEKTSICDTKQRVEISQAKGVDHRVWHDNRFYEIEADRQPPARKRPSFREKKIPADFENADKAGAEPVRPSRPDQPSLGSERREEKGSHNCHYSDKPEMSFLGNREANRGEAQRGSFPSRDRYSGGSTYGGRGPSGARIEKWKHDMFEEANRSPTPKNEDDPIAKVEALLAS
ncbi:unnamed protein product [Camellia sinensis]